MILRFLDKVKEPESAIDCWEWTAGKNKDGYGNFSVNNKIVSAHRVAYELYIGKVPDGKELDHICGNRSCVSPWHLHPVTHRDNVRRGNVGRYFRGTHCKNGHEFSIENTYAWRGSRYCKTCRNIRQRKEYKIAKTKDSPCNPGLSG